MYERPKIIIKDPRVLNIVQKARAFGVNSLINPMLVEELLNLTFEGEFEKEHIDGLLGLYESCDKAIEEAQMSGK